MTKEDYIRKAKEYRAAMDDLLKDMHALRADFNSDEFIVDSKNPAEAVANHILSIRNLEAAQMRQGKVLENIGTPDPYPTSKNPDDPTVHPKAE